jgi:hypothetical protein
MREEVKNGGAQSKSLGHQQVKAFVFTGKTHRKLTNVCCAQAQALREMNPESLGIRSFRNLRSVRLPPRSMKLPEPASAS